MLDLGCWTTLSPVKMMEQIIIKIEFKFQPKSEKLMKKEQIWFFKELKEHFQAGHVL